MSPVAAVVGAGEHVYGVGGRDHSARNRITVGNSRAGRGGRVGRRLTRVALAAAVALTAGCGGPGGPGGQPVTRATSSDTSGLFNGLIGGGTTAASGNPGYIKGFIGGVVADEPNAALVGREVLSAGGTAADAAVAVGFALTVTLPSRAGLGGGGACLAYVPRSKAATGKSDADKGVPEAVMFLSPAPASAVGADRPAGVPMLARGLYALHARFGTRRFESLVAPAEQMAHDGIAVSRGLAHDLGVVAAPLAADAGARAVFFTPAGAPVAEGARLVQPGLAATLSQLRRSGVGDLYQGGLAHTLAASARDIGAGLTLDDLRRAVPTMVPPLTLPAAGGLTLAFLPPPADGGLATAAAFAALPGGVAAAGARGLAAAARWRQGGSDAQAILASTNLPAAGLPALPASSTFITLDPQGGVVVCAVTMNNLFGTGRIAAGTGMVLAASPAALPPPLLAAVLAYDARRRSFHAAVGGSGQDGAPLAAALALRAALAGSVEAPPSPEPGRANVIECAEGLPRSARSCAWRADPRGSGLALGSSG